MVAGSEGESGPSSHGRQRGRPTEGTDEFLAPSRPIGPAGLGTGIVAPAITPRPAETVGPTLLSGPADTPIPPTPPFEPPTTELKALAASPQPGPQPPAGHPPPVPPRPVPPLPTPPEGRRAAAPLLVSNSSSFEPELMDRFLDAGYRWRTAMGVALAAIMTAAVVIAFWAGVELEGDPTVGGTALTIAPAGGATSTDGGPGLGLGGFTTEAGADGADGVIASSSDRTDRGDGTSQTDASIEGGVGQPGDSAPGAGGGSGPDEQTGDPTGTGGDPSTGPGSTTSPTSGSRSPATTAPGSGPATTGRSTSTPPSTTPSGSQATTTTTTGADQGVPQPVRVEAESGRLLGQAQVRSDHSGYTGSGFIGNIITKGSGVELRFDLDEGGTLPFKARYSAGEVPGKHGARTLTVRVNGKKVTKAELNLTPSWDDWDVVVGTLTFDEGENVVTLTWQSGNTGWVNIDHIEIG